MESDPSLRFPQHRRFDLQVFDQGNWPEPRRGAIRIQDRPNQARHQGDLGLANNGTNMNEHAKEKRTRIWIDRLQTELCTRIALYLALYQIVVVVGLASWY